MSKEKSELLKTREREFFFRIQALRWQYAIGNGHCVYFVQGEDGGPIKIGHAKNLSTRITDLQVGNPSVLRVVGLIAGTDRLELDLHRRFSWAHLRGEWFSPDGALVEFIESQACLGRPTPDFHEHEWEQKIEGGMGVYVCRRCPAHGKRSVVSGEIFPYVNLRN